MRTFALLLLLLQALAACVATTLEPPSTQGRVFSDQNGPKVEVVFPFDIYLVDKQTTYSDISKVFIYRMSTDDISVYADVIKEKIQFGAYEFLGADDALIKSPFHLEKKKNGYCSVGILTGELYSALHLQIRKYPDRKSIITVNIYKNIGQIDSRDEWAEDNRELIDTFIHYSRDLCGQLFDGHVQEDGHGRSDGEDPGSVCSLAATDDEQIEPCARFLCEESILRKLGEKERYRLREDRIWFLEQTKTVQLSGAIFDKQAPGDKSPYYGTYQCTVSDNRLVSSSTTKSYFSD